MSERDPRLEAEEAASEPSPPGAAAPPAGAPDDELDDEMRAVLDEVDVRDLLRTALAPPPGAVAPSLLRGVQRKLRTRSRGKFYGDGWSTAESPRSTYLVTSALMLALLLVVFFVLVPWGLDVLK